MRRSIFWLCIGIIIGVQTGIIAIAGTGIATHAQNDEDAQPWLTLFNADPEHRALFQPLALDDLPDPFAFTARLNVLPVDVQPDEDRASVDLPESIYIAIENTAWSEGAIGLSGEALLHDGGSGDPDDYEDYVALEVWSRMGNLVLRDDGQGLMFPLEYVRDLDRAAGHVADGEAAPGFRLDVLLMQRRTFRLYRVVEGDGLLVWGKTHVREGLYVESPFVSFQVDPEPVLGDLLLDVHIIALPVPTPVPVITPSPAPSLTGTPAGVSG